METLHESPPRWALLTGATTDIGKAMASRLASAGYNLVLVSERDMELTLTQAELSQEFPAVAIETFSADLSVASSALRLYEAVSRRRPRIDVLVNESWTGEFDLTETRSLSKQLKAIRINIEALTTLCQRISCDMAATGGGRILNVGFVRDGFMEPTPIYSATCAFVEHYSRALAGELEGTGVSVTCLRAAVVAHGVRGADSLIDTKALDRDYERVAELAFDGLMRGDEVVALDGTYKTPFTSLRAVSQFPSRQRALAGAD
jgi:short-subunit dehydrogenase